MKALGWLAGRPVYNLAASVRRW